jgi:putative intracellular protease/amidase
MIKNILMVVTNVNAIDKNHPTGLWLEEFAIPYTEFVKAGYKVTVASPLGGKIPLDPNSLGEENSEDWQIALKELVSTQTLQAIKDEAFDALILPGGHGPMFDLASDTLLAELLKKFAKADKVIGAVCHGPAALVSTVLDNGRSLVYGKNVTGFTNVEERAVQLDKLVPFLLEDKLIELGGKYTNKDAWQEYVVVDGNLITGQNPQSSSGFAKAVLTKLQG